MNYDWRLGLPAQERVAEELNFKNDFVTIRDRNIPVKGVWDLPKNYGFAIHR